jgi:hypothetical protein
MVFEARPQFQKAIVEISPYSLIEKLSAPGAIDGGSVRRLVSPCFLLQAHLP